MKKPKFRLVAEAFTLVVFLVLVLGVAILLALLLPAVGNRPHTHRMPPCVNNLRQIGLALQMFADENNNQFPPRVSITNGGSLELLSSNSPALHFRTLSNYLSRNWLVFLCPADLSKQPLTNNGVLTDRNVSHFFSVDATPRTTNSVLAGDHNLEASGQPVKPGFFMLTTNTAVRWTREMHSRDPGRQCGCILFADSHVEFLRTNLTAAVQLRGLANNRLAVP